MRAMSPPYCSHSDSADVLRAQALELFDGAKAVAAESLWEQYGGDMARIDASLGEAGSELESALVLDASREDVRARLAEVLFKRMLVVETMHETRRLDEMQARLELYDVEGALWRRWNAPAELRITSVPAGAVAALERYEPGEHRRRVPTLMRNIDTTAPSAVSLASGSYRLIFQLPGYETVYYPLSVTRGEQLDVTVSMPRKHTLPPGFVYIPAGRFLLGSFDLEPIRSFFAADPGRPADTGAYLIARHETTNAEYIEFLEALPPELRAARLGPEVARWEAGLGLTQLDDGAWQFELKIGEEVQTVRRGERVRLPGELAVDWLELPVSGLTWSEAQAYVDWLERGGKRPGARLCSEREWERAARGADDRQFPHGDSLSIGDANFGTQQAGVELAPSVIGSYPISESPFGVMDMAGSVVEWVSSYDDSSNKVTRGGGYLFEKSSAAIANRAPLDPNLRAVKAGIRVCATPQPGTASGM